MDPETIETGTSSSQQPAQVELQQITTGTTSGSFETGTPPSQQLELQEITIETTPGSFETGTPPSQQPAQVELQQITSETPSDQRAPRPLLNLPREDLIGIPEQYRNICVPLYEASVRGNWEAAIDIIDQHPGVIRSSITANRETALHIAASAKSTNQMVNFVRNLVRKMEPADLLLVNLSRNTALHLAAAGGNVSIAEILRGSNPDLLNIPGGNNGNILPLYTASLFRRYDMVNYLYRESNRMDDPNVWTTESRGWVLLRCVEADFFDIAVRIVTDRQELAISGDVLRVLAKKTDAFGEIKPYFIWRDIGQIERERHAIELLRTMWTEIMTKPKQEVDDIIRGPADPRRRDARRTTYSSRMLFIAAEMGNTIFLVELIRQYPDLIWKLNDKNQSIFHVAVSNRHQGIYNLLYEIGSMKDFITPTRDVDENNMLHLAAKIANKKRLEQTSGVALQMQRELLWYKEVESMLPPSYQEKKNNDGKLPHELFSEEHKDLMSASEKWMKDTASHSMVVAALIATVVFAAAFTVPGGYSTNKGIPYLQSNKAFMIFVVSDAISLTFSTSSILMFLYILTSRYAEHDFLESLPKKLMIALASLFLSITAMMVAFTASFISLYYDKLIWVPILISIFASVPVVLYTKLQYYGLVADVYHSTYGSKNLFNPKKTMLY